MEVNIPEANAYSQRLKKIIIVLVIQHTHEVKQNQKAHHFALFTRLFRFFKYKCVTSGLKIWTTEN